MQMMEGLEGATLMFKRARPWGSLLPVFAGLHTAGIQAPGYGGWDPALQIPPELGTQSRLTYRRPRRGETPNCGDVGAPEGSVRGTSPHPAARAATAPLVN